VTSRTRSGYGSSVPWTEGLVRQLRPQVRNVLRTQNSSRSIRSFFKSDSHGLYEASMLQTYERHTPNIDATAFVHEGAWVIGQVEVGPQSSVWPTAVLRGDVGPIRIGARSNIQDGAICHDTTSMSAVWVGDEVTVGHRAILHGCRIEDRCLIGMGAIVLDNAVVGEGSVIGAGAVVVAGTIIPPNSIVFGTPGKVVRSTSDTHRRMIEAGWAAYVEETRRWLAQ
jgi:carbonic anhydrase/acetyltransferase-like protein (isoleucine patch superfamily)